jgi:imidazolonepropionase-like amidohydrolase
MPRLPIRSRLTVALLLALLTAASVAVVVIGGWCVSDRPLPSVPAGPGGPAPRKLLPEPPADGDPGLVIRPVTVVDVVTGRHRPDSAVVVHGDRIASVGPAATARVPAGATVINGREKYLIPGLWDMHAHLADESFYDLLICHGVTGVRHMMTINPAFRPGEPADRAVGPVQPRLVKADHVLDGPDTLFPFLLRGSVYRAGTAAEARDAVGQIRGKGNDFLKVYNHLPREAYLAAVAEARAVGLPVVGHVPHAVTVVEASHAGQRTIEHLDGVAFACSSLEARIRAELCLAPGPGAGPGDATRWRLQVLAHDSFDAGKAAAVFRAFADNGTWHVPTLVQTRAMAQVADPAPIDAALQKQLPPLLRHFWEREVVAGGVKLPNLGIRLNRADLADRRALFDGDLALVRRMHRAGVRVLAGTDTPAPFVFPGASLHDELALLVEAGLTPAEALRAATLNAAVCLGREKELGAVEPGQLADLVLLARDPLADVRNTRSVEAVIVGGRVAFGPPAGPDGGVAHRTDR